VLTALLRVAEPLGRDWFSIPWEIVYKTTGLTPQTLPGVRTMADHPVEKLAPRTSIEYAKQAGASAFRPFLHRVHRSHLPVIGFVPPPTVDLSLLEDDVEILRPYQLDGVRFLRERCGALLLDAQRVGKTPQVVYAHEPEYGPLVVVGPVASRTPWHEWAARRFGRCQEICSLCDRVGAKASDKPSFVSLDGRTPDLALLQLGAACYFLTYAVVDPWSEQFAAFGEIGTLVIDEAHLSLQHRKNVTAVGIKRLAACSYRRIGLSGTIMWNKPAGLFPILDIICPAAFGDYWPFCIKYAAARPSEHGWIADGVSNEGELEKRLSAIALRRTWEDVQKDLPKIIRSVEYVPLDNEAHAKVYDAANEIRKSLGERPQTVVGNLARLCKLYAETKLARAVELIRETISAGQSLVAWTWHREIASSLAEELGAVPWVFGPIHGQLPPAAREQILEEAREEPGPRVLIATMGALGTAVSLNWATQEVFLEIHWTAAIISQAEARPYDGTRPIAATYLVADSDPDRRQCDAILAKLTTADRLGLGAKAGSAADVLATVFQIARGKSLDAIAELIAAGEAL